MTAAVKASLTPYRPRRARCSLGTALVLIEVPAGVGLPPSYVYYHDRPLRPCLDVADHSAGLPPRRPV